MRTNKNCFSDYGHNSPPASLGRPALNENGEFLRFLGLSGTSLLVSAPFSQPQPRSPPADCPALRRAPGSPIPSATFPHPAVAQRRRGTCYILALISRIPKMVVLKPPAANASASRRHRSPWRCRRRPRSGYPPTRSPSRPKWPPGSPCRR